MTHKKIGTKTRLMEALRACHCCGLVHRIPALSEGQTATCTRCRAVILSFGVGNNSASHTAALATGALILYWPAVLLPILESQRLGHRHEASLLRGTFDLIQHGSWFVGGVVLLFSIVLPLVKIVMLLELSLLRLFARRHRAITYRIMEQAGKWGMMDVMLLAFLVMLVKLGDLATFKIGPAVIAFVGCVTLSMLASLTFDRHAIWEAET